MSSTADRYAKALFETAREQNMLEAIEQMMTGIRKLIMDLEGFRQFLSNPILSCDDRCAVIKALFEGKVPALGLKFLLFITHKNRLSILKSITESYDELYLAASGQLRAHVTSAFPLQEFDKNYFNQRLHDKFQCRMLTKWKDDPSLIGGFRIFVKDKVYDYSFKDQLKHYFQQATQPV